jgi:hypothetical protein
MSNETSGIRWFWMVTAANVLVCVLLIVVVYAILTVLAAFAAGVTEWPAEVLLVVGLVLSLISWSLARRLASKRKRWIGYAVNGSALAVYLLLVVAVTGIWFHATRRRFLIPACFQGELILIHAPNHGEKGRKGLLRTTYQFPVNGVLVTSDPAPNFFSDQYNYIYPDGHLQKLHDAGPGTLPDTTENRANTTEVITYFGRSSPTEGSSHCSTEEISIGTRAFLLSRRNNPPAPPADPAICY